MYQLHILFYYSSIVRINLFMSIITGSDNKETNKYKYKLWIDTTHIFYTCAMG